MKRFLAGAMLAMLVALPARAGAATCLEHPYDAPGHPLAADVALLRNVLAPFESLAQTLDDARPRICLIEGPSDTLGTFGAEENRIAVAQDQPQTKRVAILIHELRHLDQYRRGICPAQSLDMRANARAMFALEADAMAITHLVAWAGQEAGMPALFAALGDAPETADIAAAFLAEMMRSDDPSLATAAAFDAWYASDIRRERYYVSTCMTYLDDAERDARFPGTAKLSADFLAHICNLPDRSAYPCREPEKPLPR